MGEYKAIVRQVHDGDSIYVVMHLGLNIWKETGVRLVGIQAPELGTVLNPNEFGEIDTIRLMSYLGGVELFSTTRTKGYFGRLGNYVSTDPYYPQVTLVTEDGDEYEKYGRVLATVYNRRDDETDRSKSLNDMMLEEGASRSYSVLRQSGINGDPFYAEMSSVYAPKFS